MSYPIIDSVGVVVIENNSVLLVKQGKSSSHYEGKIGLPAGKIDKGEKAIESAKRELEEDTGLKCKIEDLIQLPKVYKAQIEQKDGIKIFIWYVFLCKKHEGKFRKTDETEPFWLPLKSLDTIELLPNVLNAVQLSQNLI